MRADHPSSLNRCVGARVFSYVIVVELDPPLVVPVQAIWQRHTVSEVRDVLING
jgi:hypothetical protein